ncbi:MAG: D-alanyl-D-alanine carboxypeptidase [Parcubacteria group bacterium]|nr:D-alanyl-D-alanine carboxypeptidase [Parcubacteria group bacterium]
MLLQTIVGFILLNELFSVVSGYGSWLNKIGRGDVFPAVNFQQRPDLAIEQFINSLPLSKIRSASAPVKKDIFDLGVALEAKSAVLIDDATQSVLFEKQSREIAPIASLTKLVSALVYWDLNPALEGEITLEKSDYLPIGRNFLKIGEHYAVKDIFYVSLVGSDNTAMNLLVKSSGKNKEEFAALMNQKAAEIGMKDSYFAEPTGLEPKNVSTAYDVALLLAFASENEDIKNASLMSRYLFYPVNSRASRLATNTDPLLNGYLNHSPYQFQIGKTGYLEEAGYCFGAMIWHEEKEAKLTAVVLGAPNHASRFQEVKSLIHWGFENYEWIY